MTATTKLEFVFPDLNGLGVEAFESDYETTGRREGRVSRIDFLQGWCACAVRCNMQAYFSRDAKQRFFR